MLVRSGVRQALARVKNAWYIIQAFFGSQFVALNSLPGDEWN